MRTSLLISAAALIAGSSLALAQGMPGGMQGKDNAPGAQQNAPAAPQSAPAERIVPPATTGQGQSRSMPESAQAPPGNSRAQDMKKNTPETTGQGKSQTTGQGAASTSASLTGEQRSKISAAIKQQNAQPVRNAKFTVSIGTAIPHDIRRAPLPATVVEVYPVWRGYEYIVVEDEIVVIDPATLRIVAILEA